MLLFFSVIRTYSDGVVFTRFWADHDEAAGGQLDWLCYSHIYLFVTTFVKWHLLDISHHIQLISSIFYQEGFCECVVLGKGYP